MSRNCICNDLWYKAITKFPGRGRKRKPNGYTEVLRVYPTYKKFMNESSATICCIAANSVSATLGISGILKL